MGTTTARAAPLAAARAMVARSGTGATTAALMAGNRPIGPAGCDDPSRRDDPNAAARCQTPADLTGAAGADRAGPGNPGGAKGLLSSMLLKGEPQPRRAASPAAPDARRPPPDKPLMGGADHANWIVGWSVLYRLSVCPAIPQKDVTTRAAAGYDTWRFAHACVPRRQVRRSSAQLPQLYIPPLWEYELYGGAQLAPHRLYVLARLLTPPKGVWEGPRAIVHLPRNTRCRFLSPPPRAFLASSPRAWEVCLFLCCGNWIPLSRQGRRVIVWGRKQQQHM
eukprot:scaffold10946_cov114-Isochrysis_galbana.AAC.9